MALLPRCGARPQYMNNGLFVEDAIYSAYPLRHNAFGAGPTFVINTSPVPYGSDAVEAIPRADVVDLASITAPRSIEIRCGDAQVPIDRGRTPPSRRRSDATARSRLP